MIVAYDLRYAADHFTGIGTHAYSLLDALLRLPGPERYAVLWDSRLTHRRFDLDAVKSHPRVQFHEQRAAPLDPRSLVSVGSWLRALRPGVYLSPFYFLPARAGCPCVLTLHDVWPLRIPEGFSAWRMLATRWAFARMRGASSVVTSSAFSRGEIVELLRLPADRVRAIRLGVPLRSQTLAPRRPATLPEGPFALAVGDNRPRKNLEVLARAWAAFGEDAPLRLVGAGPVDARYPSLEAFAKSAGARRVTGLGWLEDAEIDWLYSNARLVLYPTRYEGFGFPLVEAFSRGVPVLASDIPVLREIGDGVARFLPADNPAAWADAVGSLAVSGPERDRMQFSARQRASELTYARTAEETLALLREAANLDTSRAAR